MQAEAVQKAGRLTDELFPVSVYQCRFCHCVFATVPPLEGCKANVPDYD